MDGAKDAEKKAEVAKGKAETAQEKAESAKSDILKLYGIDMHAFFLNLIKT